MVKLFLFATLALLSVSTFSRAAERPAPLKALLVIGGCCHDYAKQKDILQEGLQKRANLKVDLAYSPDGSTKPPLPILGNAEYAKGYDVIIHDECAADIKDLATVDAVLKPHRHGVPAVNLHCAMHSYRVGDPNRPQAPGTGGGMWFDFVGLQSSGHGPQLPIMITYVDPAHPITKGLERWETIKEELYNNIQIRDTAHALAHGKQGDKEAVVVWTNAYGSTRVFNTTIGHNNETVADERYLDLVTRGLLWACDKLDDEGRPKPGFGPASE